MTDDRWQELRDKCALVIPGTVTACGEDGNFCSDRCDLLAALDQGQRESDEALHKMATARRFRTLYQKTLCERREKRLREAVEDYLLWEPGKRGHAAAHKRLRAALAASAKPEEQA